MSNIGLFLRDKLAFMLPSGAAASALVPAAPPARGGGADAEGDDAGRGSRRSGGGGAAAARPRASREQMLFGIAQPAAAGAPAERSVLGALRKILPRASPAKTGK